MQFEPVRTAADLASLDQADVYEGYVSAERGDPEPGPNRGRAFWHGWRNRMIDMGILPVDDASIQLVREVLAEQRSGEKRAAPLVHVGGDDEIHPGPRAECALCGR